jgi:polyphosphate kinase
LSRLRPPAAQVRYLNRELSWLNFNRRVLEEAANPENPVLERLKFLAIFESNLDEFYMVRVSGLIEQYESGVLSTSYDGRTPTEQLRAISDVAAPLRARAAALWKESVCPELAQAGIRVRRYSELSTRHRRELRTYFEREVFPLCTPLVLHPADSVPFISNRSLNLAVALTDGEESRLARVKIPSGTPRLIRIGKRRQDYVLLEEVIAHNLQTLFPGVKIEGAHVFRVVRDADVEIRELDAADLISSIEETLRLRRFGDPVLLQHGPDMPESVRSLLMKMLNLDESDVFVLDGILGMEAFWELAKLDRPDLRFPTHVPFLAESLSTPAGIFETVASHDVLVHHPFDSFRSVETFVASAERDPQVVGIKQTLYRVGSESPIVESLLSAAESGKQVAAMVELKARFDESNNLVWARALERAGVHVTYGFRELKTHCKLCLVVRREKDGMRQYAHIGTGNYNPSTARLYTDLGLFTCDEAITQDIAELFNYLTGFSKHRGYRKLLVAPLNLREGILERIYREADIARSGGQGRIVIKVNALVDPEVIDALYEASEAGVSIDLLVRGACSLRCGVPGLSENIRVISVVGRFLEHSRVYYFGRSGQPDVFIGSADCMRRNLDRRVEVLVPVEDPRLIHQIETRVLAPYLKDTVRAWEQNGQGDYRRREGERFDAQAWLTKHPLAKLVEG